ncbi:hypothetical protein ScalyP_jg5093 [Parmales sp. scaly parma]|nr:hypothetical protein ScalyP_jg5093 [Parmales sp. scaly parma]
MKSISFTLLLVCAASMAFTTPPLLSPQRSLLQSTLSKTTISHQTTSNAANADLKRIERIIEVEEKKRLKIAEKLEFTQKKMAKLQELQTSYLNGVTLQNTNNELVTESTLRSAVKSFLWRIIAGSVTFVTAVKFSGSVSTALTIVGSDFVSKSATMFIGERLMNKSQAGRKKGGDDIGRSLMKALIWRVFALCNTLAAGLLISGNLKVASKIASSDAVIKTAMMFVYERTWAKIGWGKEYDIDFSI